MDTIERRPSALALTITACLAALLGIYSAFAVVTVWGALTGLAGGVGAWISVWILRQRPGVATRVVAVLALVVNVVAFALAVLFLLFVLAEALTAA